MDIGHVNLINFLRTIRRCSEALSSVKLVSCKTINPKCKIMFVSPHNINETSRHSSSMVSPSYFRVRPMQSLGHKVWTRIGYGTSRMERHGVSKEEDGNCRDIFQLQIVSWDDMSTVYECHFHMSSQDLNLHFSGDPIPRVKYTQAEVETWRAVYKKVSS